MCSGILSPCVNMCNLRIKDYTYISIHIIIIYCTLNFYQLVTFFYLS